MKASEVFNKAAKLRFYGEPFPLSIIIPNMGVCKYIDFINEFGLARYWEDKEHGCILLCMAAAIAESEGN